MNATGKEFTALNEGFYVAPIREKRTRRGLYFNSETNEITESVVNKIHNSYNPHISFKYNKNIVNITELASNEVISVVPDAKSLILEGDTIDVLIKVHRVNGCEVQLRLLDATYQLFVNSTQTVRVDECKNKINFDTKICKTLSIHLQLIKTECGYAVSLLSNN